MYEVLSLLTFWIGTIGFLDLVVEKSTKNKIAEFIFGFHRSTAERFEAVVMKGILSPLVLRNRISLRRAAIFSFIQTALYLLIVAVLAHWTSEGGLIAALRGAYASFTEGFYIDAPIGFSRSSLLVAIPIFAIPFDFYSFWITKKLFWNRTLGPIKFKFIIALDIGLSFLPLALFAILGIGDEIADIVKHSYVEVVYFLFIVGMLVQSPTSIVLNIAQIIITILGSISRLFIYLTKLNQYVALHTQLHEAPFAFLGFLAGIIAIALSGLDALSN